MEAGFKLATAWLALAVELGAALIIALAALEAVAHALRLFVVREELLGSRELIRLQLGRWLTLALEFELAADILRTAIAPTWNDIGQLGAIIVLRTLLNYFLERDIVRATERQAPHDG